MGAELQSQPILLVVDAGDDLGSAVRHIELFKGRHENGRVLVLADPGQQSEIPAVFRAGANGYLLMSGPSLEPLIKALELVMLARPCCPRQSCRSFSAGRRDSAGQTSRGCRAAALASERLILRLLAEGLANKVIATKIGIAGATVKVHVKSILLKIGVVNRTQAAIWAMNNGLFVGGQAAKDDVRENLMSDAAAAEESYGTGRTSRPLEGCAPSVG